MISIDRRSMFTNFETTTSKDPKQVVETTTSKDPKQLVLGLLKYIQRLINKFLQK
jgi:hypothetical protein